MRLQSTHIRIQTFWDNLNYDQVILLYILLYYPPLHQSWRDLVVCRLITPPKNDFPFATNFCLYHHKSLQYKSDTMNNA